MLNKNVIADGTRGVKCGGFDLVGVDGDVVLCGCVGKCFVDPCTPGSRLMMMLVDEGVVYDIGSGNFYDVVCDRVNGVLSLGGLLNYESVESYKKRVMEYLFDQNVKIGCPVRVVDLESLLLDEVARRLGGEG